MSKTFNYLNKWIGKSVIKNKWIDKTCMINVILIKIIFFFKCHTILLGVCFMTDDFN